LFESSSYFKVVKCFACGTLWTSDDHGKDLGFWDESLVPAEYARALRRRRARQVPQILRAIRAAKVESPILDYGSGQGVLLASLVAAEMDAWGCDFYGNAPLGITPVDRFLFLDRPWELPKGDWSTIVLLDVVEHHPDPVRFLRALDCKHLVIKVPLAKGPLTMLARLAAKLGHPSALDSVFQAGSPMPHRWLPTVQGLDAIAGRAGWARTWKRTVPEVGSELPDRIRLPRDTWSSGIQPLVALAGWIVGGLGWFWSDTLVAVYERS
jgi:hypothetical protein